MLSLLFISSYFLKKAACTLGGISLHLRNSWRIKLGGISRRITMSVEDKFQAAVKVIKSLPSDGPYQPSNETKLRFYSLYKQATDGPCKQGKPAFWDLIGRAKWDSWSKLGDIGKDEAMNQYIDELKKIVETMSFNGDVQDFLDSIGPFYEFISINSPELDNIKDVVDRLTSSSSSDCTSDASASASNSNSLPSSPETTPLTTPAKEPDSPEALLSTQGSASVNNTESEKLNLNQNHVHTNGHIPNKKLSHNQLNTVNELMSGQMPPPSPMHTRSMNGFVKRSSIEDIEREDEVLEVATDNLSTINHGLSSPGSESDKYYSGDSESDVDQVDESSRNLLPRITVQTASPPEASSTDRSRPGPSTSSRKIRPKNSSASADNTARMLVDHSSASDSQLLRSKVDSVAVLQGTVDRLNRDIDHVLARLRILEAAYSANPGGITGNSVNGNNSDRNRDGRRPKPLRELSGLTWAVIFAWPVAVHFMFKLISWWLERRRKLRARPLALTSS